MFRNLRLNAVVVPVLALLAILTLSCSKVEAQVKPFKVTGEGNAPEGLSVVGAPSPYTASGTATHLGRYSGFGIAQVTGSGTFTGGFVFEAANGDRLVCKHPGTFALYPDGRGGLFAVFDAIFSPSSLTIDGTTYQSTGRFANAGGSFRMIAITESFTIDMLTGSTTPFDFEWNGEGTLSFPKK